MAWTGLAGLALSLDTDVRGPGQNWLRGGGRGLAFGFGANLVFLRFVPHVIARFTPLHFAVGILALALLALAQGVPWGAVGILRCALGRYDIPRPLALALAVYAGAFFPAIFPWTPGGTLGAWPTMVQLAEHVGERGVSALVALSAGLMAEGIRLLRDRDRPDLRPRALLALAFAVALPSAMAIQGTVRMRAIDALRAQAPTASIGLVDAAVPAATRWDAEAAPGILALLTRFTIRAEQHRAEATVWPESAYPYVLARGSRAGPAGTERLLQPGVRGPLLVGAVTQDAKGDRYNAAVTVHTDGVLASEYDKLHLLWFGEEVPFATELPWIRRTFARGLGMVRGARPVLSILGRVRAGSLICFEDTLPEAGREAASLSPNLLVNMTNDAWFAGSAEPQMHLRLAVMRAIEARRDLVRAVNLGPTGLVDAAGRVREIYDLPVPGSLVVSTALLEAGPTLYVRFGDWPWVIACAAVAFASRAHAAIRRTKRGERQITERSDAHLLGPAGPGREPQRRRARNALTG